MLLNVAAHKVSIQNVKVSKHERYISYSVTKLTALQKVKCTLCNSLQNFLLRYMFCDTVRYVTFRF
jgi:hypothetical protein